MPKVSIIVPVYKVELYLERCVDSILAQTFTDFELILVDDGSPDNCPVLCDQYARMDSRIRVIHKENGGLSSARNAGLDVAVGEYILFCDSDDEVDSEWVQMLYKAIEDSPKAWVMCNLWRGATGSLRHYGVVCAAVDKAYPIDYYTAYKKGISGFVCNKIYNHHILTDQDIRFDESCRYAEDVEFNVKYYRNCTHSILVAKPLYYYYDNFEGITHTYHADLFELRMPQFLVRFPIIDEEYRVEYCDEWVYTILQLLKNRFDSRNNETLFGKLRYNQKMLQRKDVQFCIAHASGQNEHPIVMNLLRRNNYYLLWAFEKVVQLKQKLGGYFK